MQGCRIGDVNEGQKGAMGVSQPPHQPPGFRAYIQIPGDFEAVKALQEDAQANEQKQRPPPEVEVSCDQLGHRVGSRSVFGTAARRFHLLICVSCQGCA